MNKTNNKNKFTHTHIHPQNDECEEDAPVLKRYMKSIMVGTSRQEEERSKMMKSFQKQKNKEEPGIRCC